jgi:hypothetical protein
LCPGTRPPREYGVGGGEDPINRVSFAHDEIRVFSSAHSFWYRGFLLMRVTMENRDSKRRGHVFFFARVSKEISPKDTTLRIL